MEKGHIIVMVPHDGNLTEGTRFFTENLAIQDSPIVVFSREEDAHNMIKNQLSSHSGYVVEICLDDLEEDSYEYIDAL